MGRVETIKGYIESYVIPAAERLEFPELLIETNEHKFIFYIYDYYNKEEGLKSKLELIDGFLIVTNLENNKKTLIALEIINLINPEEHY